jgi:GNAT superfamily N-acetyltransferase
MTLDYRSDDRELTAEDFLALVQRVWSGQYTPEAMRGALTRTRNITARDGGRLVDCARLLTDDYFFGTIPEILVDLDYRRRGIGRRLMELTWEAAPTSLYFGAQPGNEPFFERLGYARSLQSYSRRKPRPAKAWGTHPYNATSPAKLKRVLRGASQEARSCRRSDDTGRFVEYVLHRHGVRYRGVLSPQGARRRLMNLLQRHFLFSLRAMQGQSCPPALL